MFPMRQEARSQPSLTAPTGDGSPTEPSSVSIERAYPAQVLSVWPVFQRAFRKAQGTARGDMMDELDILSQLCEGGMMLLTATVDEKLMGGLIIQFQKRPKGKACVVMVSLFDKLRDIPRWSPAANDYLIEYARTQGCYTVEAYARDGAVPWLKQIGWRRKAILMEKRL